MTDRSEIQKLLWRLYAARMNSDLDAIVELFCANAEFRILGASQRSPVSIPANGADDIRERLALLLRISKLRDYEELSMIIDEERAAVQWRAMVYSRVTPGPVSTEFVDVVRICNRRILTYTELFAPQAAARTSTQSRIPAIRRVQ